MNFIELGRFKIEVKVVNGIRMVKQSDVKELLDLKDHEIVEDFIEAGIVADTLFKKIYITKDATKEQEIIHRGLCIVGIYPVIDEVCKIDLRTASYSNEFLDMINKTGLFGDSKIITIDNPIEIILDSPNIKTIDLKQ